MATPGNPAKNVWHLSRGIVFANDKRVVYPRLPMSWYHNTPNRAASEDSPVLPPTVGLQDGHHRVQIVNSDNGQAPVVEGQKSAVDGSMDVTEASETIVPAQEATEEGDNSPCHPPVTDLEFKIPEELFQAARSAPEGSLGSFWSYNLYRGPGKDGPNQKVKVHYCTSRHTTERVLQQYFMNEKVLGFDLEWEPTATSTQGPRRNISLVQIASPSRIGLFHVALYPEKDNLVAPSLKKIMEDPEVTKAGVWISGDCTRLRTYLGINSRGILELSHLHKLVKYSESGDLELVNKRLVSLANQIQEHMHLPLFKGDSVRASQWSKALDYSQIMYSASDAYAGVQLFAVLDHKRRSLDPVPPLPHPAELKLPIVVVHKTSPVTDEEVETSLDEYESGDEFVAVVKESLSVEDDDVAIAVTTTTTTSIKTTVSTSKQKQAQPQDPRVAEAESLARQYSLDHKNAKTPVYALRAYYLWYKNEDTGPEKVAALLRDPPLSTSTVVNYITNAIKTDKLPFDKRRLREEILATLPKGYLDHWRFKSLVEACQE